MSSLFTDTSHSAHMAKQQADLYMRLYQYAAEDFTSVTDMHNFAQDVIRWAKSVEERLTRLSEGLRNHSHEITPHVHPMPHTHTIPPHTHVGNLGSPVSPTPLITLQPSPNDTVVNIGIQTQVPLDQQALEWRYGTLPLEPSNTTGAISNMGANNFSSGTILPGTLGDSLHIHNRRSLVIPILTTPTIPPVLKVGV